MSMKMPMKLDVDRSMGDPTVDFDPQFIDRYVGIRLCMLRRARGLSQAQLGERLKLSLQQVKKYEKGTNRVSVSRLIQLCRALDVDVAAFFHDLEKRLPRSTANDPQPEPPAPAAYDIDDVMRRYQEISDERLRAVIAELIDAVALD